MSVTTILWVVLYVAAIIGAIFSNPLFGAMGYLLEYYMRPALKWWGDELPDLRYNLIISIVLGGAFLIHRRRLRPMSDVPNPALRWLLALMAIMMAVTATVALDTDISLDRGTQWFKMAIIFPVLLAGVTRRLRDFDLLIATHMLGAFWWGWVAYTDPKREAGRLVSIGSGDSLNDNTAAAHLLTVLPFALIYLMTEKDKRLRAVALLSTPFVINTLILCNSRGSMVGMAAGLGAAFFMIRTGYRARMVGAAILFLVGFLSLADTQFLTRQQTTTSYEQDGSAQQRLTTWVAGIDLIKDYPFGTGGRGFHILSPRYIPDIVEQHNGELRAPHNTYVMVAAEWGVLGLVCYLGAFGATFRMLRQVKRRAEARGPFYWRALSIQIALVSAMVAATFSDRLYGEAPYWMIGLAFALYRVQCTDLAEAQTVNPRVEGQAAIMLTPPFAPVRP